jgi:hypothetical protein
VVTFVEMLGEGDSSDRLALYERSSFPSERLLVCRRMPPLWQLRAGPGGRFFAL